MVVYIYLPAITQDKYFGSAGTHPGCLNLITLNIESIAIKPNFLFSSAWPFEQAGVILKQ